MMLKRNAIMFHNLLLFSKRQYSAVFKVFKIYSKIVAYILHIGTALLKFLFNPWEFVPQIQLL